MNTFKNVFVAVKMRGVIDLQNHKPTLTLIAGINGAGKFNTKNN
jgi:signal recognition particle GTPase